MCWFGPILGRPQLPQTWSPGVPRQVQFSGNAHVTTSHTRPCFECRRVSINLGGPTFGNSPTLEFSRPWRPKMKHCFVAFKFQIALLPLNLHTCVPCAGTAKPHHCARGRETASLGWVLDGSFQYSRSFTKVARMLAMQQSLLPSGAVFFLFLGIFGGRLPL